MKKAELSFSFNSFPKLRWPKALKLFCHGTHFWIEKYHFFIVEYCLKFTEQPQILFEISGYIFFWLNIK